MGLLRKIHSLHGRKRRAKPSELRNAPTSGSLRTRSCRFEQMEPRLLLSADPLPIQVGTVYYEDSSGYDEAGDVFEITFAGGAPGTQMTESVIETDKMGDGLTIGDVFFDVAPTGLGAFDSAGMEIISQTGIDSVQYSVEDGGTTLVFTFSGFEAGDRLVFSLDVDEQGFLGPNAVAEGNEVEGSQLSATFAAPHFHTAAGSDIFIDNYDPKLDASGLDLPPDSYVPPGSVPTPVRTAAAVFAIQQEPLPISISGTVFEDFDRDNSQDAGDPGIAGVQLSLLELDGSKYVATGRTTTTDADGNYRFENLLPGTYRVVETQPGGYLSVGATAGTVAGLQRGSVASVDVITSVELLGGEDSVANDFAEVRPASISGRVIADMNANCTFDAGDTMISGVTVQLIDASGNVLATAQTDADGVYEFSGLMPGVYGVAEIQPAGYLDACDHVGTAGGTKLPPDSIIDVDLGSGTVATGYDFMEVLPASISGYVYVDHNNNGVKDAGEAAIGGVEVALLDAAGNPTGKTTTTDASGYYAFDNLRPGKAYGVAETQPDGYWDGLDAAGTAGGTAENPGDRITGAVLAPGVNAKNYNFGELESASISGYVYVDANNDGAKDVGEASLAGVTLMLLDAAGNPTGRTTTTDATGYYVFDGLRPNRAYGVAETQPGGYWDGLDAAGTAGGTAENPGDRITGALLAPGESAQNYNFGELESASISGYVYVDRNNDGAKGIGEAPLAGVTLMLLDAAGNPTGRTTTTDATGYYVFDGLRPDRAYGVAETQPDGYWDGLDAAGTAGGTAENPGDRITGALLAPGASAKNYNFGELESVSLSGYVYVDANNDGVKGFGEAPLAGVTLMLLDADGNPTGRTTTTDAAGYYVFDGLQPDLTYGVAEAQPQGYLDGLDSAGTAGGSAENPGDRITGALLPPGTAAKNYNFGEIEPASIAGRVHADLIENCVVDPGEPLLSGVTIRLFDAEGQLVATTTTDAQGEYLFDNLMPGTYTVAETQPSGYYDGPDSVGSVGGHLDGNDRIAGIVLASGTEAVEYNFCELVPASISGYVFQDGPTIEVGYGQTAPDPADVRDGVFTPDDKPIAGVVLRLGDASGAPILDSAGNPITTVTNAQGYYRFNHLRPGVYTVLESHPDGYTDSLDTPGSKGGIAVNRSQPVSEAILQTLAIDPMDDAILRISVSSGDASVSNNFSEVRIENKPPVFPPPDDPDPPVNPPSPKAYPGFGGISPAAYYVPAATQKVLVPLYGGGAFGGGTYTWHLSVINGGQPRRLGDGQQQAANFHNVYFNPVAWTGPAMDQSQWVLADAEGQPARNVQFGLLGGTPVTGDFNGDGVTDVGVFFNGLWFLDLNGNGVWDEGDLWAKLGEAGDMPVTGDWDGDGKDDIGIYGPAWEGDPRAVAAEPGLPDAGNAANGRFKNMPPDPKEAPVGLRTMKRTAQGDLRSDLIDHVFRYGTEKDVAIAGDWNGDGVSNIGLFREGAWFLDADGDGHWSTGDVYIEHFGQAGDLPVVGDFNGDGVDELGVYRSGMWYLDSDGDRALTAHDKVFQLGGPHDKPAVGDFNGDGVDELALYRDGVTTPDAQAAHPPTPAPADGTVTR